MGLSFNAHSKHEQVRVRVLRVVYYCGEALVAAAGKPVLDQNVRGSRII
jgi:hypothetical protein